MKIGIIIQARMGSTRLPGKAFREVLGRPLLGYLVERVKRVKDSPTIILATTTKALDDLLVTFAAGQEILCFRGSEDNVLERFYLAAKAHSLDVIVRVTGDCPLIDPAIIDKALDTFIHANPPCDYVSNTLERSYPRGMDVEVFSFKALEKAYFSATQLSEQEHVTPYLYQHPEEFVLKSLVDDKNNSTFRWTVDTPEDFELIKMILEDVYPKNPTFGMKDLLKLLQQHPDWSLINRHIEQKKIV